MLDALRARFGDRCSTAQSVREQHGRDESTYPLTPPEVVVFCESTEDVVAVVKLADQHAVPVIPFGVGSSLEGHTLAVQGGVTIDLGRMNRVVRINPEDLTVTVEAGVTREQVNREIRDSGLFFPIDPGANASIGGMSATRASGTNAVRYGTMRENVLGLTVVTAGGEVIHTGTRAQEERGRLRPDAAVRRQRRHAGRDDRDHAQAVPAARGGEPRRSASFPASTAAVRTTIQVIQMGVPIARCELLDANAVRAVNKHSNLSLLESPMLLMEFHGSDAGVKEQAETVQDVARDFGGTDFQWATTPEERTKLWTARHKAYFAALQTRPGCRCLATDTCVPISHLAESINESIAEAESAGIPYWVVGHVGDGNFDLSYLVDPNDAKEAAAVEELSVKMVRRALRLEGTCTGEHGIGLHKMGYLVDEAGVGAVEMMKTIKRSLDPKNIMNPGKVLAM